MFENTVITIFAIATLSILAVTILKKVISHTLRTIILRTALATILTCFIAEGWAQIYHPQISALADTTNYWQNVVDAWNSFPEIPEFPF
jgi:hypothetical protein